MKWTIHVFLEFALVLVDFFVMRVKVKRCFTTANTPGRVHEWGRLECRDSIVSVFKK